MSPRRLVVGVSALALTFGACSPDDGQPGPADGSALASSTSTSTSTSTVPSSAVTNTTATTAAIPGGCPSVVGAAAQSAQQAARCFIRAWEENSRAQAATFASLDVVDVLFQQRWTPPPGTFNGCSAQPPSDGQLCTFEHRGTRYQFDVRRSEGGWRVTQLQRPAGSR